VCVWDGAGCLGMLGINHSVAVFVSTLVFDRHTFLPFVLHPRFHLRFMYAFIFHSPSIRPPTSHFDTL